MKIEKKILPKSIVELIVEESIEEVAKSRKKALDYLEKNSNIKGFRAGAKIPENVLLKEYSEEHINKLTIDFAIDGIYREALKKEKILPVSQGEIKEIISEKPLKIKIHIEVFPEIIIDQKYKKIKIKKQIISVSDEEVKNALAEIETKFTKFEEVTDEKIKTEMGDKVTIDTDGYEKDEVNSEGREGALGWKILESTSMKDYPIILGSNILVPGFEEQIVGAKLEDFLEFPVVFPKDYHNESFKGKKTIFKVTVKKIEKAIKPEFTPEFIEQLRGKKLNLDEFKKLIKEEITNVKESNNRLESENKLIDELLKITKIDIGNSMLKNQIEKVYSEIKENITKDGYKINNYLESLKLSEDEYKEKNVKPVALKRLQGELILHKLNELEKLEVTEQELNSEIEKILMNYNSKDVLEKLKKLYIPGTKYYEELRMRVTYRKLIDNFFEI